MRSKKGVYAVACQIMPVQYGKLIMPPGLKNEYMERGDITSHFTFAFSLGSKLAHNQTDEALHCRF